MSRPALTQAGEEAWLRMKQHLEWCEQFSLIFIFTRHPLVIDVFRERLAAIWRARITGLHILLPKTPDQLCDSLLQQLLTPAVHEQALNAPCWLDLSRQQDLPDSPPAWQSARLDFLIRLNEQRERLRRVRDRPLLVILPEEERNSVRALVPDLWAIRNFSVVTENWIEGFLAAEPESAHEVAEQESFPLSDYEISQLAEWERLRQAEPQREQLLVAERTFKAFWHSGRLREAHALAQELVAISRKLIGRVGETPESLRDLSVSLEKVGDAAARLGAFEAAQQAYQESLAISRKLIGRVGETPESLRDLSVSLYYNGELLLKLGHEAEGRVVLQEGLSIAQTLEQSFPTAEAFQGLAEYFHKVLE
jgi:tetratricopeptide (TPR) repeat protein